MRVEEAMPDRASATLRLFLNICAALCLAAIMATPLSAQTKIVDHLGVPGPIRFDGTDFELAWSTRTGAGYVKQEYLPKGQSPQTYTRMVMVEALAGNTTPLDAASAQMKSLNQRKANDPLVNMSVIKNDKTGEVLLDFIVSAKNERGETIVEWNAYRYAGRGRAGLLLFAISHRAYGSQDARAFLAELKQKRPAQIDSLAKASLPDIRPVR
jgi:hypothetical protein